MNNALVTGESIPRRNDVNILEDMADIALAVKGSGLPEAFFTEQCSVWEQMQALCTYMDLTPRQVTILAVIMEYNGYASLRDMAGYIGWDTLGLLLSALLLLGIRTSKGRNRERVLRIPPRS